MKKVHRIIITIISILGIFTSVVIFLGIFKIKPISNYIFKILKTNTFTAHPLIGIMPILFILFFIIVITYLHSFSSKKYIVLKENTGEIIISKSFIESNIKHSFDDLLDIDNTYIKIKYGKNRLKKIDVLLFDGNIKKAATLSLELKERIQNKLDNNLNIKINTSDIKVINKKHGKIPDVF